MSELATPRPDYDQRMAGYIKGTVFLVEADSFARLMLWHENHERVKWEQILEGTSRKVSELDDRPVMITMFWARIEGQLVAFYSSDSEVTDWKAIERWLDETFAHVPKWDGVRRPRCDAMNFGHCLDAVRAINRAPASAAPAA